VKLYQFPYSPFAAKVRIGLKAKGLACELVDVPYLERQELVAISGGVMVPVLVDGETVVKDSPAIMAYLDQHYAPSLRESQLAVIIEQWADGAVEDVAFRLACPGMEELVVSTNGGRADVRAMFRLVKERRYGVGCIEAWKHDAVTYSAHLKSLLAPVVAVLERQPYLLGESLSLADAAVVGQLSMVEASVPGWLKANLPALLPWFVRVSW
jgi:glutathione S-transferase